MTIQTIEHKYIDRKKLGALLATVFEGKGYSVQVGRPSLVDNDIFNIAKLRHNLWILDLPRELSKVLSRSW